MRHIPYEIDHAADHIRVKFEELTERKWSEVAKASGVERKTPYLFATGQKTSIDRVELMLNAIGYSLTIRKL